MDDNEQSLATAQQNNKSEEDIMKEWEANLSAEGGEQEQSSNALSQDEIDSLLGFGGDSVNIKKKEKEGIESLLDKSLLTYERLPMLEVVFDRFVRLASTSLRNFTSESVDLDVQSITALRFEEYLNSIPMPAMLTIFRGVEWENFGLLTFDGSIVYSMVDVLFGGRRSSLPIRIEGRPYTTIEQNIIKHLALLILNDVGLAFDPLSPTNLQFERLETNPRFATIARPGDPALLLKLKVDMESRGGVIELLLPYATIEPIRPLLTQVFMGEKFGKDIIWESHFGTEIINSKIKLDIILGKKQLMLNEILSFKIGDIIIFDREIDDELLIECEEIPLFNGKMGQINEKFAISITGTDNTNIESILNDNS